MKIKKNIKNIISIILLVFILFVLIFAISSLKKSNNLNAVNNNNKTESPPPFSFVNARSSAINGINYENNFGGSNQEKLFKTYKFDCYVLIGSSMSNDYYFGNQKNNSLVIMLIDTFGNCLNVYSHELGTFEFVNSVVYNNSIFIAANVGSASVVLEFNLSNRTLKQKTKLTGHLIDIASADELVLIYNYNNRTNFLFLQCGETICADFLINNIQLAANYANGMLIITNYESAISILYVTKNSIKTLNTISNSQLETFNITNSNIILITKTNNVNKLILLNLQFEVINEKIITSGTNFALIQFGNYNILSYLTGNTLKQLSFCSCGDELNNSEIFNNATSYNVFITNNNINYLITTTNNSLHLITSTPLAQVEQKLTVANFINANVCSLEINNNLNLAVFGEFGTVNTLLTKNFGNTDIFMFEIILQ